MLAKIKSPTNSTPAKFMGGPLENAITFFHGTSMDLENVGFSVFLLILQPRKCTVTIFEVTKKNGTATT